MCCRIGRPPNPIEITRQKIVRRTTNVADERAQMPTRGMIKQGQGIKANFCVSFKYDRVPMLLDGKLHCPLKS